MNRAVTAQAAVTATDVVNMTYSCQIKNSILILLQYEKKHTPKIQNGGLL